MDFKELIKQYLNERKLMQLATVSNGQPWVCTVHYVHDDDMNVYWLSLPSRRHSQEIKKHPQAAITVPIKFDRPVIGIQAEGMAETVNDAETIKWVMQLYIEKFNAGKEFYNNFVAGKSQHEMYKFTSAKMHLFDEVNFPDKGRQEWSIA